MKEYLLLLLVFALMGGAIIYVVISELTADWRKDLKRRREALIKGYMNRYGWSRREAEKHIDSL